MCVPENTSNLQIMKSLPILYVTTSFENKNPKGKSPWGFPYLVGVAPYPITFFVTVSLTDRPASRAGSLLRRWSGKWVSVLVCIMQMKHHTRERRAVQNDVTNDSTPTYLAFPVEHVKAIRLYASKPFLELHTGRSVNLPHKFLYSQIMLLRPTSYYMQNKKLIMR